MSHILNRVTSYRARYAMVRVGDITKIENDSCPRGLATPANVTASSVSRLLFPLVKLGSSVGLTVFQS